MQAVATIRRLAAPPCQDFHPSLLPALCQAAAKAQQPEVFKEAASAAVQMLIVRAEGSAGSCLPPGQEAALLLALAQAIGKCLEAAPQLPLVVAGTTNSSNGSMALFSEMAATIKLAAQRLKLLGWQAFAGERSGQV